MNGKSHLITGFVSLLLLAVINFALIKEEIDLNVRHKNHGVGGSPLDSQSAPDLGERKGASNVADMKSQDRRACDFVLATFQIGHREGRISVHFVSETAPIPAPCGL